MDADIRSPRGASPLPRQSKHAFDSAPALQLPEFASTSATGLGCFDPSTVAPQQTDPHMIYNVNSMMTDARDVPQIDNLLPKDPQPRIRNNCDASGDRFQGQQDRVHEADQRRSLQYNGGVTADHIPRHDEIATSVPTVPTKKGRLRKEWESLVCRECINSEHLEKHLELNKKQYKGQAGALSCKQAGCGKWVTSLLRSDFVRSEYCTHTQNVANGSMAEASTSTPLGTQPTNRCDSRQLKAKLTQSQKKTSKVFKQQLPLLRTRTGKFMKRPSQQGMANNSKKIADSNKEGPTRSKQSIATKSRLSRISSGIAVTNGQSRQGFESFNLNILNTYEGRHIEEDFVRSYWGRITNKISEFDKSVRAVASHEDVRKSLRFLDSVTPLSDLQEIVEESRSPEECDDPSRLLLVLKAMFKVPMYTSLHGAIPHQLRELKFPFVLRAALAYLLHLKIFSAQGRNSEWQEMEKRSIEVCGEQQGAALFQYLRLGTINSENFKWALKHRAKDYARSIHTTLLPLCQWADGDFRISHDLKKQLELLTYLTYNCLCLSTELQAREGIFIFVWPTYGEAFDPSLFNVEGSQGDAIVGMGDEAIRRQSVALTLMPAVQRVLPLGGNVETCAQGMVILKQPFAD